MIEKMGMYNKMDPSKFPVPSSEKLHKSCCFFIQILYVPTYACIVYRVVRSNSELISSRYSPPNCYSCNSLIQVEFEFENVDL